METKKWWCGIADAHGLESFFALENADGTSLQMRAMANRQRHAVFFTACLDDKGSQAIEGLCKGKKWKEALNKLKEVTELEKSVFFPRQEGAENSWGLIPNERLDPMYSGKAVRKRR